MNTNSEISNAAAALGRQGGKSRSDAKQTASRVNGKLGGRPSLYEQAERRIDHSPKLSPHKEFILADWPEGDEHLRWVIKAPIDEILDWIQAGQS